jgi:nicotinamidase-related amidase
VGAEPVAGSDPKNPRSNNLKGTEMATAFIGLDFINDIVHPEGKISHTANLAAERGVIEKVNRALATARERGWLTILVKVGFAKGYTDQPKHSPFFGRLHEISALEAEFSGMDEVPIW